MCSRKGHFKKKISHSRHTVTMATQIKPSRHVWQFIEPPVLFHRIVMPAIHEPWVSAKNWSTCWTGNFIWAVCLPTYVLYIFYFAPQFIGTLVIKWNAATAWTVNGECAVCSSRFFFMYHVVWLAGLSPRVFRFCYRLSWIRWLYKWEKNPNLAYVSCWYVSE